MHEELALLAKHAADLVRNVWRLQALMDGKSNDPNVTEAEVSLLVLSYAEQAHTVAREIADVIADMP
jgi:hypothetical protein